MPGEVEGHEPLLPLTDAAKEQIKLRANWLNGLSVATFAVGTLASASRALLDPQLQSIGLLLRSSLRWFVFSLPGAYICWQSRH